MVEKDIQKKSYDYDVLILLMGTNPLPNYVVAKYFLKESNIKKIIILHSKKTCSYANMLSSIIHEELIKNGDSIDIVLKSIKDVGSATDIGDTIHERDVGEKDTVKVHLNYTGGTKAMAVHAYQSVKGKFSYPTFSYLDARQFKILNYIEKDISTDLRKDISIDYETLIKLHLYQKHRDADDGLMKEDWLNKWKEKGVLEAVSELIGNNDNIKSFKEDLNEFNKKKNSDKYFVYKASSPLLEILLAIIPENHAKYFQDSGDCANKESVKQARKDVKTFIPGIWLEHYVWMVISQQLQLDEDVKEYERNLFISREIRKIKKEADKSDSDKEADKSVSDKEFEIDVILLNGYQVCGISVTTSPKERECKLKGFEVLHRVSQFGGDEGKAILVTLLNNDGVDRVQGDIDSVALTDRFKVLGAEDLEKNQLWRKVKEHVWGV